jgi:hypothetical protein
MKEIENMRDSRFDYDVDSVGLIPNLKFKRNKNSPIRNFKCVCSKCGKEFLGYKLQSTAEKPLCPSCIEKKKLKQVGCSICGRKSRTFANNNPETKDLPKICSFCKTNKAKERFAIKEGVSTRRCRECNCKISNRVFIKQNGLCSDCIDTKKILNGEVI